MQWEIVVAVIIAIGIYTAIVETWAKRAARKKEVEGAEAEQHSANEVSKKQDK